MPSDFRWHSFLVSADYLPDTLRAALIRQLDLPEHMTADALLDVLNALMSREEFYTDMQ